MSFDVPLTVKRLVRFSDRMLANVKAARVSFEERRTRPRSAWGDGGFNPTTTERRTGTSALTPDVEHALVTARDALMLGCKAPNAKGFALDAINGVLKRAGWVWFQPYRVDPRNLHRVVRDGPPVLVAPDSVRAISRGKA